MSLLLQSRGGRYKDFQHLLLDEDGKMPMVLSQARASKGLGRKDGKVTALSRITALSRMVREDSRAVLRSTPIQAFMSGRFVCEIVHHAHLWGITHC